MKIWQFSTSGWMRGAGAAVALGAVLVGAQSAQASLIGTTIDVFSNVGSNPGFTGTDTGVLVVDDVNNPELASSDGVTDHGANFFLPTNLGGSDFYDIQADRIIIHFGPNSAGQGGMIFSNLDWGAETGILVDVQVNVLQGTLSSPVVIQDIMNVNGVASFEASIDCLGVNDCQANGVEYELVLITEHTPPGPPGPNPPGPNPPGPNPPGPNPPGTNIPEPGTMVLFVVGLAGLGWMIRRRRISA